MRSVPGATGRPPGPWLCCCRFKFPPGESRRSPGPCGDSSDSGLVTCRNGCSPGSARARRNGCSPARPGPGGQGASDGGGPAAAAAVGAGGCWPTI